MTLACRIFLKSWAFLVILGLLLVALFTIAVDPYAVFGTPRLEGVNALKPAIGTKVRMAKVHQVMKALPRAIVIGNSRPEMGLDPDHPCWPAASRPVYNVAVPGLSVYGQVRYGQHALASGEVGLILVGLDFIDFLVAPDRADDPRAWPILEQEPMPLRIDAFGRPRAGFFRDRLKDRFLASLSLDALGDSIATLIRQDPASAITRTTLGFNPGEPIFGPIIRHEGARLLFEQKDRELARRLSARPWALVHAGTDWSASFEAISRLLGAAKAEGAGVMPFINPLHADFLLLIDQAGLWPLMEAWKRRVLAIAAGEGKTAVWDFSGLGEHALESVDEVAARGESLRWFWEPSHYRQALGDRMLSTMLAASCPEGGRDAFGVKLTPAAIDAALAAQRLRRVPSAAGRPHGGADRPTSPGRTIARGRPVEAVARSGARDVAVAHHDIKDLAERYLELYADLHAARHRAGVVQAAGLIAV
jgi:hypothetical protein